MLIEMYVDFESFLLERNPKRGLEVVKRNAKGKTELAKKFL